MSLRIFIGESDRRKHQPLGKAIVLKAREMRDVRRNRSARSYGLRQVQPGPDKILRLSADAEEKINSFLPVIDAVMSGGLVTLEKVRVIDFRSGAEFPESKA